MSLCLRALCPCATFLVVVHQHCAPAERGTKACAVWGLRGACSPCFTGRQVLAAWLGDTWLTFVSVPSVSPAENPSSPYLRQVRSAAPAGAPALSGPGPASGRARHPAAVPGGGESGAALVHVFPGTTGPLSPVPVPARPQRGSAGAPCSPKPPGSLLPPPRPRVWLSLSLGLPWVSGCPLWATTFHSPGIAQRHVPSLAFFSA